MWTKERIGVVFFGFAVTLLGLSLGPISSLFGSPTEGGYNQWSYPTILTTFEIWEEASPTKHLFLAYRSETDFHSNTPWTSVSTIFLASVYVFALPARLLDAPNKVVEFATIIPGFLALLWLTIHHLKNRGAPRSLSALWFGIVLTSPSFWVGILKFELTALVQVVPTIVFCHLSVLDAQDRLDRKSCFLALLAVALFNPVFVPAVLLAIFTLSAGSWNRLTALGTVVGMLCLMGPRLVAKLGGQNSASSSLLYRTGLDGSTQHFQSIWQAMISPVPPDGRQWSLLVLPLVAVGLVGTSYFVEKGLPRKMMRQLLIATLPYFYVAIVFPQAVSVHPYCYDLTFLIPAAFSIAYWLNCPVFKDTFRSPGTYLAGFVISAALLMTNLIELSRFKA